MFTNDEREAIHAETLATIRKLDEESERSLKISKYCMIFATVSASFAGAAAIIRGLSCG